MGIWIYENKFKPIVDSDYQLTIKEGNTPLEEYKLNLEESSADHLFIKREDLNPTKSFKDRCLAYQLSRYYQLGKRDFAISSSGNAAVSSIAFCKKFPSSLHVFVSNSLENRKLKRLLEISELNPNMSEEISSEEEIVLSKNNIVLHFSKRPKSNAFKFSSSDRIILLNASKDDLAIEGYKTISYEILKDNTEIDAVFIPCSSGTSTVGIYNGFRENKQVLPQFHIAQTSKVHPIAKAFDDDYTKTKSSLATAITDRVAHRKEAVVSLLKQTNGSGWILSDNELLNARKLFSFLASSVKPTYDSLLAFAAFLKASKNGFKFYHPLLIFSG